MAETGSLTIRLTIRDIQLSSYDDVWYLPRQVITQVIERPRDAACH